MNRSKKIRVLFINRSYWPDTEATGQLLTALCEDLASEFEIEVISGRPNHTNDRFRASTVGIIRCKGVTIQRVLHTRFPKSSSIGRILNLMTFTASAFLATLWRSPRPDIVITETDPFFLPLLGRFIQWRYRIPFVAYLQDIYPDIAIALGKAKEGRLTKTLRNLLVSSYNKADRVVVLCNDMKTRCIQNGVQEEHIDIIPNWADCRQIYPIKENNEFRKQHQLDGKFVVMYSGNLGMAHLLDPILDAAVELKSHPEIVFLFIGEGVQKERLRKRVAELGLNNVRFLGYQPEEFLKQSLSAADIQIVSMLPEVKGCLMPSKLYGVLASGTAVLSISPRDSDLSQLIISEDVGLVCDPNPSETLNRRMVEAIRGMATNPDFTRQQGVRGRALCLEQFDRHQQVARFAEILRKAGRVSIPETSRAAAAAPTAKTKRQYPVLTQGK
ncbi:glycosyltransferase family 4 protein [Planctomicrobium sp. SH527]|uniref:glycosyltransferase family 4 protein n=1 Tax=Planctomicrobium sp. SH527 TaxID=3448123 RepID=UPI003F5B0A72